MTVHIIGGGIAGLAASIGCLQRGLGVRLYEAAPHLGGRCRSFFDATLGVEIDNGTHAFLASNAALHRYINVIGSAAKVHSARGAPFFIDIATQSSWAMSLLSPGPGIGLRDMISACQLFWAKPGQTASDVLKATPIAARNMWEPLCTAALNTPLAEGSAQLLAQVIKAMALPSGIWRGLQTADISLSQTFIDPAAQWIEIKGGSICLTSPLRELRSEQDRAVALKFDGLDVALHQTDVVILALPPWSPLLAPFGIGDLPSSPIVHAHFKPTGNSITKRVDRLTGLIGGQGQWLLERGGVVSVTISAADQFIDMPPETLAKTLWQEIAPLSDQNQTPLPPYRVIKERRATLRHTPDVERLRPKAITSLQNVFLAGDWTATGLPCTLESAAQSGFTAARLAID